MMKKYLYPTEPFWVEEMAGQWIKEGSEFFSFCFLNHIPTTLTTPDSFWLYLYYTKTQTTPTYPELSGKILYRAKVIECRPDKYNNPTISVYEFKNGNPKVWFKCSQIERICNDNGNPLTSTDFIEINSGKDPAAHARNSIPEMKLNNNSKIKVLLRIGS